MLRQRHVQWAISHISGGAQWLATASAFACLQPLLSPYRCVASLPPDSLPTGAEEYYWVPAQPITPASIAQRRATGRLESALETVLLRDGVIREQLVSKFGLNIHQVQLAKDRRTVFILWDAHAGMASACENALQHNAFRLRRDLAKLLNSKHTPFLEFRHDHLPPLKAAVAATMEQVEQELTEDAMMAEKANSAAEAAAAGFPSTAAVEAAIARLEAITAPYERQGQGVELEDSWQDVDQLNVMDNDVAWNDLGEGIVQLHLHEQLEEEEEEEEEEEGEQQQQQQSAAWKEPEI